MVQPASTLTVRSAHACSMILSRRAVERMTSARDGRIAPGELGAAAARNHGEVCVICETKSSGKLLLAGGFENEPRLNAANRVSRSSRADRIRGQNRAEFVFDVDRSRRHLRDSVHYNSSAPSRHAIETKVAHQKREHAKPALDSLRFVPAKFQLINSIRQLPATEGNCCDQRINPNRSQRKAGRVMVTVQ